MESVALCQRESALLKLKSSEITRRSALGRHWARSNNVYIGLKSNLKVLIWVLALLAIPATSPLVAGWFSVGGWSCL